MKKKDILQSAAINITKERNDKGKGLIFLFYLIIGELFQFN